MAKDWIQGAVKHPGALHSQLGVPQGATIPKSKLRAAIDGADGPLAQKRANLAKTLGGFNRK